VEVILLKKVSGLGALGDKVSVRPGYGRNYLIPSGIAVPATATNLEAFEARRAELEREAAATLAAAEARRDRLADLTITVARRAGDEGRLFGSVGANDIVEGLRAQGVELDKQEVRLPSGPLRSAGEHEVKLHLHPDVEVAITVEIVAES
jgi:large subunit ribosomal protein L9